GVKKSVKRASAATDADAPAEPEDELKSVGHIELALYTGQFTRDESSGVDFLVVGDVNPNALKKYVDDLEKRENKVIRYAVMPLQEFEYRQQINDRFATGVTAAKKQVLIDTHGLMPETKPRKRTAAETTESATAKAEKTEPPKEK